MSQEDVYNISINNATVRAWITNYQYNKDITYVDALEGMVLSLVEQNAELSEELVKLLTRSTNTLHFEMMRG